MVPANARRERAETAWVLSGANSGPGAGVNSFEVAGD